MCHEPACDEFVCDSGRHMHAHDNLRGFVCFVLRWSQRAKSSSEAISRSTWKWVKAAASSKQTDGCSAVKCPLCFLVFLSETLRRLVRCHFNSLPITRTGNSHHLQARLKNKNSVSAAPWWIWQNWLSFWFGWSCNHSYFKISDTGWCCS